MHSLSVSNIAKHFTRKKALDDVSLTFETGRVYALLGENGAGKSTLASLLSGDAEPTAGCILLDEQQVTFKSPHDALENGIAMVRQQPLLADELPVWENCILGNEMTGMAGFLRKRESLSALTAIAQSWGFSVNLEQKAGSLTAPERLFGALLANLYKKPRFLILDEPSATLDQEQRKALFTSVKNKARKEDMGIIFITHNIQEALDYADAITILQKGRVVFSEDITQKKPAVNDIADMLFARKEGFAFTDSKEADAVQASVDLREPETTSSDTMLEFRNVTFRPDEGAALFDISFTVPKGQLTCISGQRESGMDTLEDLITGMTGMSGHSFTGSPASQRTHESGILIFDGTEVRSLSPRFLRQHGTAIIPFRKRLRGSNPNLTIAELLGSTGADPEKILTQVQTDITAHEKVQNLSGGMLQRLIVARELYDEPSFVIMSNPAYGLDRFSTGKIAETVEALLRHGATVLVLGDEPELARFCTNSYKLVSGHLSHIPLSTGNAGEEI